MNWLVPVYSVNSKDDVMLATEIGSTLFVFNYLILTTDIERVKSLPPADSHFQISPKRKFQS